MKYSLPGSARRPPFPFVGELPPPDPWPDTWDCDITVYVRPAAGKGAVRREATALVTANAHQRPSRRGFWSADQLRHCFAAAQKDRDSVVKVFTGAGIKDVRPVGMRAVQVRATWGQLRQVIEVDRRRFPTPDGVMECRIGRIKTSSAVLSRVDAAIFGLDNRRALSPYVIKSHVIKSHVIKSHVIKSHDVAGHDRVIDEWREELGEARRLWFTPDELARQYGFPAELGRGCRVGVLAFSGRLGDTDRWVRGGYHRTALTRFFRDVLGRTAPKIKSARIRGPGNWPGDGTGPDDLTDEVMLDLTVAGALAPEARFRVYFSEPTEQGFVDALHHIVELRKPPDILLICYGSPENLGDGSSWTRAAIRESNIAFAAAALRGITVVTSCGDNGAAGAPLSTRVHADFPASSPWVLGCGGTRRRRVPAAGKPREIVWNDGRGASGGGISAVIARPRWQQAVKIRRPVDHWRQKNPQWRGRGVPDVAAVADPETGLPIVDAADDTVVVGGTSVSAAVWAGLLARYRQRVGSRMGFLAPDLYGRRVGLRDIANGDNGAYAAVRNGWDPCTGWGVPRGKKLRRALR